jgi:hypothetical protein
MISSSRVLGFLFLIVILGCPAALAVDALFLGAFPEFRQTPPDWLKPGVRISYRMGTMNTPGPAAFPSEISGNQNNATAGYYQIDIVSVEPNEVVCVSTGYNEQNIGNPEPFLTQREVEAPGISQYWLHPSALQKAEKLAEHEEMLVMRMPYTIDGKTYQAVRIEYTDKATKSKKQWLYDTETGMLLRYYHNIQTVSREYNQMTDFVFAGVRNIALPKQNATRPAWVKPGITLQFSGTYSSIAYGSGTYRVPYSLVSVVESVGNVWSKEKVTAYMNGQPQNQVSALSAIGHVGGAWLAPGVLATMKSGMMLDTDNVTGTRTVVTSAGAVTGGQTVVTIQQQGGAWSNTYSYDARTGVLTYSKSIRPIGMSARMELELYLKSSPAQN